MTVTDWYQAEDAEQRPWFSVQNKAGDPKAAEVDIYDDIIPFYGANATDFRNELKALGDDVETINLHVHSRGGNVYEAVAMMNTLRQHKAKVVTTVDSVAASAAGFIAVGASDELIVAENAEIMAHLPWAMSIGNAADMRKAADDLERIGKNIASIFADKAGGTVDEWMDVLSDETWWSAQEAVDAGIADRVLKVQRKKPASKAEQNRLDLSVFNHAGRSHAPAPRVPLAHNQTPPGDEPEAEKEKEPSMGTLSESALQKLGLDADADDSAIEAAITALSEKAAAPTEEAAPAEPSAEQLGEVAAKFNAVVVDRAVHDKLIADAAAGAEARAQQIREANEATVQNALAKGQISPSSADTWRNSLAENRDGALALLATIPENRAVPTDEIGHGVTREDRPEDSDKIAVFAQITGRNFGEDI